MRLIKTTVIFTVQSRVVHALHGMARINLPTYFRIASCTRSALLNTEMFHWDGFGLLTSTGSESPKKSTVFHCFLPAMASDHTPMNYYRAYSKNRCVYNLLALWLSVRTCWQWAGPKLHSLLSAHHLIGACFLTTESDKRTHLLTRLFGTLFQFCLKVMAGLLNNHTDNNMAWVPTMVLTFDKITNTACTVGLR